MCGRGYDEEETLELDKKMLELFRQYEGCMNMQLSGKDVKKITEENLSNYFLLMVRDRLPAVLEMDKRGEYDN